MHNNEFFEEKPLLYEKGEDFIGGIFIIFVIFSYLVTFHGSHGSNMKPMVIEKS